MATTGSKPIDELVRRAIIGDGTAFTALWDKYIDVLRAYLRASMKIQDEFFIDDICSRSFEKAFRQIGSYNPSLSQFPTWLKTIAHNTALDTLQSERRASGQTVPLDYGEARSVDDGNASPLEVIISDEDRSETLAAIQGLPALYREVAYKRFIEDYAYKDIAEKLSLELNTVRTRIRRAKALMDSSRRD